MSDDENSLNNRLERLALWSTRERNGVDWRLVEHIDDLAWNATPECCPAPALHLATMADDPAPLVGRYLPSRDEPLEVQIEKLTTYVRYLKQHWRDTAKHEYELEQEVERLREALRAVQEQLGVR